jgi:hypothetical protein
MAKKVQFLVNAFAGDKIYMCGNLPSLGDWNPKFAVELKRNDKGLYQVTKMLPENQIIEFKFMEEKDWETVEKGEYDEEVKNHILVLPTDEETIYYVAKFNKKQ